MMKTLMRYGWLFLALAFSCRESPIEYEAYGRLSGLVLSESQDTLDNVFLSTNPATQTVTSDAGGRFLMDSIPVGEYSLRARRDGYREEIVGISIEEGLTSEVTLVMAPAAPANLPPSKPSNPQPPDGATGLPLSVQLSWQSTDENEEDTLTFDLVLYWDDEPDGLQLLENYPDTTYLLEALDYATDYYWQAIADDGKGCRVFGEIWHFRTEDFPELPISFVRKSEGKYDIFGADQEGRLARLTRRTESSWRPRMSPQRDLIAFLSFEDFEVHLFTMNREGGSVRKITAAVPVAGYDNFELDFCWSPDGARLLYMYYNQLYVINRDGSGLKLLAEAPADQSWVEVDWNGPGNYIAARRRGVLPYNSIIFKLRPSDGAILDTLLAAAPGAEGGPAVYIDGSRILYTYDVSGFENASGRQLDARIFELSLTGGAGIGLSGDKPGGANDLDPRYSPTGAQVAFTHTLNTPNARKDLWIMDADGGNRELFLENAEMADWN